MVQTLNKKRNPLVLLTSEGISGGTAGRKKIAVKIRKDL
jgi:hypothetical protein